MFSFIILLKNFVINLDMSFINLIFLLISEKVILVI